MKVFRMCDEDWVAANSKEEAISFYLEDTGVEEAYLDVKECSLKRDGMFLDISTDKAMQLLSELSETSVVNKRRILKFAYFDRLSVWKPFEEAIEELRITEPCIVCSTEY